MKKPESTTKNPIKTRLNSCNIFLLTSPPAVVIFTAMETLTLPLKEAVPDGRKFVNPDCWLVNTEGCVTVFVKRFPLICYEIDDLTTTRLVMVLLVESSIATQEEVAKTFGMDRITLYRLRGKYHKNGVAALIPKKRGPRGPRKTGGKKDKVIVRMKREGKSNRQVAQQLGLSEHTIRIALRRLGYRAEADAQKQLSFSSDVEAEKTPSASAVEEKQHSLIAQEARLPEEACSQEFHAEADAIQPQATEEQKRQEGGSEPSAEVELAAAEASMDADPSNRIIDRLFARLGLLDDAAPLFQSVKSVQGLGALLAIPILVAHGVFVDAMKVFSNIGPAFYGLRNTLLVLLICFLRGINRPERLKEHSPSAIGKVIGLDRAPEMKTLRRKIRYLAGQNRVVAFLDLQLQRHLRRLKKNLLWAYVDGHVSVYSGKHKLSKHYVTRLRISLPSVLDYWINDQRGDPLLVLTGRARKGMVSVIEEALHQLRAAGEERIITLVFDREGWSPELFARLDAMDGVRFVSYRKAKKHRKLPRLPASEFRKYTEELDGQKVEYELAQRQVYIDYGSEREKRRLCLRQITRMKEDGHQTHVITNDWETPEIEIAYRMFSRWSQENFLKYMGQRKDFDGLVTYLMEEADPQRRVVNPERKALKVELARHGSELEELMSKYGEYALDNDEASRPTMRGFKIANGKLAGQIKEKKQIIEKLDARIKQMPGKIAVSSTMPGEAPKQVHTQTRHLIHAFRIVVHRAETALRELICCSYPRWREEGRTLIRMFLNACGDIEVSNGEIKLTFDEQSAPHRTRLLALICNELNSQKTKFPGSDLVLRFKVRGSENVA